MLKSFAGPPEAASALDTGRFRYARRTPEASALYAVVRDHLPALLDQARARSEHGAGYPRFVEREFEKFLDCGLLCRGFVRVRCDGCASERLVAFSCKTRGFCPSCTSRRMADTAAHLVDRVLPPVPYRQWVLSLPRRVRFALARDSDLLAAALSVFLRKVFAWQRRRARARGIDNPHAGAVTFVQRFGSLLNLNCHFHSLIPDGVFAKGRDGDLAFHPLPPPWDSDVDRLTLQIARAIHKLVDQAFEGRDVDTSHALAADQARVLSAPSPFRKWEPPSRPGSRTSMVAGYSLHADRVVEHDDPDSLERLCRYGARSPVAHRRLAIDPDGDVVCKLKRPLRDGRTELRFAPIEFLRRLATLIPPPRKNLTRYHGVFAPNHPLRAEVVALGRIASRGVGEPGAEADGTARPPKPRRRLDWASLLRRVFAIDILRCQICGGSMQILAILPEGDATRAILEHLGLPAAPPNPRALDPPPCAGPGPAGTSG